MLKISVVGSVCIDKIKFSGKRKIFQSFGGITYVITALSSLFKKNAFIYPVTKIERKYRKKFLEFLSQYKNIKKDFIYDEPQKTNLVTLEYDKEFKNRKEKSFLWSSRISYSQIIPVLSFSDIIIITFISGYDIMPDTLSKIRKNFNGLIYGDIHSLILTKSFKKLRKFRRIKNFEIYLKNFDILQGSEIEWQVLVKEKYKIVFPPNDKDFLKENSEFIKYIFSLGIKKIIITLGSKGVLGIEENRIYKIPARKICKIKDTTGCGDSFIAGFIWALVKYKNFKKALEYGNFIASLKAERFGFFKYNQKFILM